MLPSGMAMLVSGPLEGLLSEGVCIPPQPRGVGHPIHCLPPRQPQLPPRTQAPPPPSKPRASLLTPLQCHISGHFAFPEE